MEHCRHLPWVTPTHLSTLKTAAACRCSSPLFLWIASNTWERIVRSSSSLTMSVFSQCWVADMYLIDVVGRVEWCGILEIWYSIPGTYYMARYSWNMAWYSSCVVKYTYCSMWNGIVVTYFATVYGMIHLLYSKVYLVYGMVYSLWNKVD